MDSWGGLPSLLKIAESNGTWGSATVEIYKHPALGDSSYRAERGAAWRSALKKPASGCYQFLHHGRKLRLGGARFGGEKRASIDSPQRGGKNRGEYRLGVE